MRATEHAPSGPFQLLERRHGLAEIVERQEAADLDLCEMIRAPVFVRGKAGFAALAEGLRDFAHKETVSDLAGLDGAFVGQRERDNWATIGD